jgi:putative heme-binding domain-containing protein
MSGLLTRFENRAEPELGVALIEAFEAHPRIDRLLTVSQAERLFNAYPANIRKITNPLREKLAGRDEKLVARFLALEERAGTGDVGRGRRIFFGERAKCSTCHAVGEEGGTLGPDLTTIGLVRTAHDLLEAVLFPSASMVPDFAPFVVETLDDAYAGIIGRDLPDSLLLRMAADEERNIARGDILSIEPSPVSIMPEGLDAELSDEELLDLLAFLQSLNNEQWLLPERREN